MNLCFRDWLEDNSSSLFWISPSGEIIPRGKSTTSSLSPLFPGKHIDYVIQDPELFGLTQDDIKQVHDRYKERLGIEGHARQKILEDLINKGWIRIRHYNRPDRWSVESGKKDRRFYYNLSKFVDKMLANSDRWYDELWLTDMSGDREVLTFADFAKRYAA